MSKIAFIDRDGTINVDKNYLYKIEDFEFLPGVIEGLKLLQDNDYLIVIVTNQSGIARGYYTERDMEVLHCWLREELLRKGIEISGIYYCPHLPDAKLDRYRCDCACRKPKTGLYEQALKDLEEKSDIDIRNSVAVGDKLRDLAICEKWGIQGILISSNSDESAVCDDRVHTEKDFLTAVKHLITKK